MFSGGYLVVRKSISMKVQSLELFEHAKQDSTESRVPRLKFNVHTNQILAHTFSHDTLDSVVS